MSENNYFQISLKEEYRDKLERLKALPDRVSYASVVMWLVDKEESK